jgi:hypothetical protein
MSAMHSFVPATNATGSTTSAIYKGYGGALIIDKQSDSSTFCVLQPFRNRIDPLEEYCHVGGKCAHTRG